MNMYDKEPRYNHVFTIDEKCDLIRRLANVPNEEMRKRVKIMMNKIPNLVKIPAKERTNNARWADIEHILNIVHDIYAGDNGH